MEVDDEERLLAEPASETCDDDDAASGRPAKRARAAPAAAAAKPVNPEQARAAAEAASQLAAVRAEQARLQKSRVRFLLGKSEIFEHFLSLGDAPSNEPAEPSAAAAAATGKGASASSSAASSASAGGSGSKRVASGGKRGRGDDAAPQTGDEEGGLLPPSTRLSAQPANIPPQHQLRDYQLEGLNWMIALHENGLNGILADEMGLGKTFQTISLLAWLAGQGAAAGGSGPHLVLVPKSTLSNWCNELARFCPALRVITLAGEKEARQAVVRAHLQPGMPQAQRGWHVLLTTYEVAVIEKGPLARMHWQYLVIDEAHRIKNENSALAQTARSLVTTHRLLITGTPLQNNLHELWALLNFLLPDVFHSSAAFDSWFSAAAASDDTEAQSALVRQLHRVLKPFMLRRLKKDVAKSLPPKTETLLYVGMSPMQKALYRSLLLRDVNAVMKGNERGSLSNLLMHLRKAANHPYLFDGQEDRTQDPLGEHVISSCAKLQLLDKLLPRLASRGSRVLLFSQFTSMLDIIEDYCVIRGHATCRIDGSTGYDEREAAIDGFNAPGSDKFMFLLSTRAGGLGINLATADIVILFDSDWNPQVDLQAMDRAHRIGQTKPVRVYRLVTSGSVEEKVIERAWMKLKLDAVVVQHGRIADKAAGGGAKLTKEEMLEMVQFGADAIFKAGGADDGAGGASISDKDIDAILALGEQKTKEMAAAVAAKVGSASGGLLDFKLETTAGGSTTQVFEGVNYGDLEARRKAQEAAKQAALREALVAGLAAAASAEGDRAARMSKGAGEEAAADSKIGCARGPTSEAARMRALLPPAHRPPRMDPWQLYDRRRVGEICAMEVGWAARQQQQQQQQQQQVPPQAAAAIVVDDVSSSSASSASSVDLGPFPQSLIDERNALLAEGFSGWRRDDLDAYLRVCARHGRRDLAALQRELHSQRGKDAAEVARYHAAFWGARGEASMTDTSTNVAGGKGLSASAWETLVGKVARGEAALAEQTSACQALVLRFAKAATSAGGGSSGLAEAATPRAGAAAAGGSPALFVPRGPNPWTTPLHISTAAAQSAVACTGWAPVSDAHLMACVAAQHLRLSPADAPLLGGGSASGAPAASSLHPHVLGALDFSAIRRSFLTAPHLRFDYAARARSEEELEARARVLLRATERELLDATRKEGAAAVAAGDDVARHRKLADALVKATALYKEISDADKAQRRAAKEAKEAKDAKAAKKEAKKEAPAPAAAAAGAAAAGAGDKPTQARAGMPAAGSKAASSAAAAGPGHRRVVPPALLPLLCRIVADGGAKGVDTLAAEFSAHPTTTALCGGGDDAPPPAPSATAAPSAPRPSDRQVRSTIELLGVKSKPPGVPRAVWALREGQAAALLGMTPQQAVAEMAARPLVFPAPTAAAPIAPPFEDAGGTGALPAAASAADAAPAAPPPPAAPTLPEPQLAMLAHIIAGRPDAGMDVLVETFLFNVPSTSKNKASLNVRAIAEKGRGKYAQWALRPAFAHLLAVAGVKPVVLRPGMMGALAAAAGGPPPPVATASASSSSTSSSAAAAAAAGSSSSGGAMPAPPPRPPPPAAGGAGASSSLARLSVGSGKGQ